MKYLLLVTLLVLNTQGAFACKCDQLDVARQAFYSDYVLVGSVEQDVGKKKYSIFNIDKTLVGRKENQILIDFMAGSSCEAPLKAGERVVVFVYFKDSAIPNVTQCRYRRISKEIWDFMESLDSEKAIMYLDSELTVKRLTN